MAARVGAEADTALIAAHLAGWAFAVAFTAAFIAWTRAQPLAACWICHTRNAFHGRAPAATVAAACDLRVCEKTTATLVILQALAPAAVVTWPNATLLA